METNKKKIFNWRSFISVLTAFSFIGLSISGIILFVVPPGRIANWTGWTIFALSKDQWIALHDWFAVIFIITVVFHLFYNIKPFTSYFKSKITKHFSLKLEWLIALFICAVVSIGTILDAKPFSDLLAWNESIKNSWENPSQQAPIPHAELLTLSELANQVEDIDIDTITANLEKHGIQFESTDVVLGDLAKSVSKTPVDIYQIALGQNNTSGSGNRFGQMTLKEYCEQMNVNIDNAAQKLKDAGFTIKSGMTIREIADSKGAHPSEIKTILSQ